jgi:MFS family permease
MTRNDKKNEKLTIVKKSLIAAAVGHAVAFILMLVSGALLMKNEDPSLLLEAVSLVALFVGSAICGTVAGKSVPTPFGGAFAGGAFSLVTLILSIVCRAFLSSGENRASAFFMMAMLSAAALLSAVLGFWISTRKSNASVLASRKKRILKR